MSLDCLSPPNAPVTELGCLELVATDGHRYELDYVLSPLTPSWFSDTPSGLYGKRYTIFGPALRELIEKASKCPSTIGQMCTLHNTLNCTDGVKTAAELTIWLEERLSEVP